MTHHVSASINGAKTERDIDPRLSLGDFLRDDCGLTGTHLACEHGVCGACTVLVDDAPIRSCIFYAVQAHGLEIRTIEGFEDDDVMRRLRVAFSEHHALQCGFCTAGMLITGRDIIRRLGSVDEDRIREELAGNLCRCTGYVGVVKAIQDVAAQIAHPIQPDSAPIIRGDLVTRAVDTVAYVKHREAFGQRLFDFQNTKFTLAECATTVHVGRVFVDSCIQRHLDGGLDATTAAMAKWWLTEQQVTVIDRCLQLYGGYGYMREYPIARMYADARVQKIYGGANEIMKDLVARSLR